MATDLRVSQVGFEAAVQLPFGPDLRVSQVGVEVALILPTAEAVSETEWEVRAYDGNRKRVQFPKEWIEEVSFVYEQNGGYGQGSITLNAGWDDLTLTGAEEFDIYLFGVFAYRGRGRIIEKRLAAPESASIELMGLVADLRRIRARRKYAYGAAQDVTVYFGVIVTDDVLPLYDNMTAAEALTGITGALVKEFDPRRRSVADAIDELLEIAPELAYWGADVDTTTATLKDRIYLRPRPTTVGYKYVVGDNVQAFVYPKDTDRIINSVRLIGGPVDQPNLITNASFENVKPNGELINNRLTDYSFELNTGWTYGGGASRKTPGTADAAGAPRTGAYWAELDGAAETISQTVPINYLDDFIATAWVREETIATTGQVRLVVEGLNACSVVQVTYTGDWLQPGNSLVYKRITAKAGQAMDPLVFSGFSTVTQARVRIEVDSGTAANDGIIVDDVAFYEAYGVGQEGWMYSLVGAATIGTLNWANKESTSGEDAFSGYHGGYRVKVDPANIAGSSDYIELRTHPLARIPVKAFETYYFTVMVRNDGVAACDTSLGIVEYNSEGTVMVSNESATISQSGGAAWAMFARPVGRPSSISVAISAQTTHVELFIRARDNDLRWYDAAWFGVGSVPRDFDLYGEYWAGAEYEREIDVTDSYLTGSYALDAAAATSITDWGERSEEITNEHVINRDLMLSFMRDWFNVHAIPGYEGSLSIHGARALLKQDGLVKLVNFASAPSGLFPVRIHYSIRPESINIQAELGREQPDVTVQFLKAAAGLPIN